MRHLKILGAALVAMFAFGIAATSAFALPDISVALGGAYPLHWNFADNGKTETKLETTAGTKLEGKGLSVLFLTTELSALGTWEASFLNVKKGTEPANSTGDPKETVLVSGTFHIVPLPPAGSGVDGILFLFNEFSIESGKVKIKVKGAALSTLNAGKESEELSSLNGALKGSKGKNELTKYLNDEGKEVEAKLESNFGSGFLQSAEVVAEEIKAPILEGKMFTITGR